MTATMTHQTEEVSSSLTSLNMRSRRAWTQPGTTTLPELGSQYDASLWAYVAHSVFDSFSLAAAMSPAARLQVDWDSYGGRPTTLEAVRAAMVVVGRLPGIGVKGPQIVPASDGGLTLEWSNGTDGVEIAFDAAGELTVLIDVHGDVAEIDGAKNPVDTLVRALIAAKYL
jgi:hypothetical protein